MPTPDQKVHARESIQKALALLQSVEQAAEQDQYQEIPRLLGRLDGTLFDLREGLKMQDSTFASIVDEYEEDR